MKRYLRNHLDIFILVVLLLFGMTIFIAKSHATTDDIPLAKSEQILQEKATFLPLPSKKPILTLPGDKQLLQQETFFNKLNDINSSIKQQQKEIEKKLDLLRKAKTEQEKINIQLDIDELSHSIEEQEKSFEMIQTGGLELAKIEGLQEKTFDWQKDLLEILQPIMNELRQLTEDKRKLVNLQNKIPFYQSQIKDIKKALDQMARIQKDELEKDALERFEQINKRWQNLLEENNHLLGVAELQLNRMIKSRAEKKVSISEHIKQFATGRGATLLIMMMAFIVVYFSMSLLWKGILWINTRKRGERRSYFQRFITLIYHATTVVFSMAAAFYVLNIRNDQVLIGVAVLLLIIIALVLRTSVPRYIEQIQILLNAGSVREDECIIYNGITMKVGNLNFNTKLTNPALPGLTLLLPLSELSNYISRQYTHDEPWFPCQQDDFVMLSDGTYGKVKCITLENILISLANGMSPKTYTITDFLATNPKNLSQGFVVTSDFGIDYKYQQHCTTQIPELLCAGIRQSLQKEPYGSSLIEIGVHFAQANTSSLDYKIIASFDGKAAGDYYVIARALQRYAVEVCNQQQWEIPFTQIVVHHATPNPA